VVDILGSMYEDEEYEEYHDYCMYDDESESDSCDRDSDGTLW